MFVADGLEGFHVIDISEYVSITYEDAEDETINGWEIYDNEPTGAEIINVFDEERQSRIIQFSGAGWQNGYRLRNDDLTKWHNSS